MSLVGKGDKHITIESGNIRETCKVLEGIHEQIVNNKDYIDGNILLNMDSCGVHLYIFKEAKDVPKILI